MLGGLALARSTRRADDKLLARVSCLVADDCVCDNRALCGEWEFKFCGLPLVLEELFIDCGIVGQFYSRLFLVCAFLSNFGPSFCTLRWVDLFFFFFFLNVVMSLTSTQLTSRRSFFAQWWWQRDGIYCFDFTVVCFFGILFVCFEVLLVLVGCLQCGCLFPFSV